MVMTSPRLRRGGVLTRNAAARAPQDESLTLSLVLVNKKVFSGGFHFPMTLSEVHQSACH